MQFIEQSYNTKRFHVSTIFTYVAVRWGFNVGVFVDFCCTL